MAFDPSLITQIQLGSIDYPAGEAVLGQYGWHILELVIDEEGHWGSEVTLSNKMHASVDEVITFLSRSHYLAFELPVEWDDFRPYLEQFGKPGSPQLSGSLNGEDFEDLIAGSR